MKLSFEYADFYANISLILDTAARNSRTQRPFIMVIQGMENQDYALKISSSFS